MFLSGASWIRATGASRLPTIGERAERVDNSGAIFERSELIMQSVAISLSPSLSLSLTISPYISLSLTLSPFLSIIAERFFRSEQAGLERSERVEYLQAESELSELIISEQFSSGAS